MPRKNSVSELRWTLRKPGGAETHVTALSCAAGFVHAGGEGILRLTPGAWDLEVHRLVPAVLPLNCIGMELKAPHRVAFGPATGDVVMLRDADDGPVHMGFSLGEALGSKQAVDVAWTLHDGKSALFVCADDGVLYRIADGVDGLARLDLPPVWAMAHDGEGHVAVLVEVDEEAAVYAFDNGGMSVRIRKLGVALGSDPEVDVCLAIAGDTYAIAVGDSGPIVSHRDGEVILPPPGLERTSAIALTGSGPDAWTYVALLPAEDVPPAIGLLPGDGTYLEVMRFLARDDRPFELGAIAWDASRKALFIASREGLVAIHPDRKESGPGKKKRTVTTH